MFAVRRANVVVVLPLLLVCLNVCVAYIENRYVLSIVEVIDIERYRFLNDRYLSNGIGNNENFCTIQQFMHQEFAMRSETNANEGQRMQTKFNEVFVHIRNDWKCKQKRP